ncbi:septation protein SepH [Pseudonocardia sp. NPDC049635]|uniref:septation protein SepH n=1 Tax=Pseudonocardia sp. NPDC049635 TaxID=3155506 RepID=UPI003411C566
MRALRVVGVTGDGSVVLEDPGRRERYTVPADEQLRAAARGDVTRLGQIAIELESQLRPREIQARIRGGASVDEVAAAAGVPTQKIERFAYPVLLERSRTAELAQSAHPQRADGPDSRTLGETVAHTFGLRGQDFTAAGWDSWKGEDGKWVIALTWQTGRSDNAAHWSFQPGAHGGTVAPLDEHASDLIEGLPARPLRPLGSVVDMAREDDPAPDHTADAAPARAVAGGQARPPADSWAGRGIAPEQRRSSPPPRPRVEGPTRNATRSDESRAPAAAAPVIPRVEPADGRPATATDESPAVGTETGTTGTDIPVATPGSPAAAGTEQRRTVAESSGHPAGAGGPADPVIDDGGNRAPDSGDEGPVASGGVAAEHGAPTAGAASNGAATGEATTSGTSATGPAGTVGTAADAEAPGSAAAGGAPADRAPTGGTAADGATADGAAPDRATAGSAAADGAAADRAAADAATEVTADSSSAAGDPPATDTATGTGAAAADRPAVSHDATGDDAPPADPQPQPSGSDRNAETPDQQDSPGGGADSPSRQRSAASRRTKKGKPVMPSWDEVLLGVRGQR